MSAWNPQANEIFLNALEIAAPTSRADYIEQACGDDAELRRHVDSLLAAGQKAGNFLEYLPSAVAFDATLNQPPAEKPGTQFGPYKLLQQIGEGGMGTVYMAEQEQPVRRKVALKVIKPGMDSGQVIARFEAEQTTLALMDHVNIARVLDAGTTEQGRLYFVMELVNGVSITKYCDDNHLTPRERLELFVPVCQAIQHAHQKGIIHRDIKPSNVMVMLYDGRPVPKVIDFGVAKATEQKLTGRTLFTQYGTMVGTMEYMSPEQAELSALGVDTRSDIYSLGVLLYELLTGSTPLSHKRIREATIGEVIRMIKEEEPPKPSTRLSEAGEVLASIYVQRQTEPAKLSKLMRGELDWIVMKTLEKDRNRRYETASGLASDVRRYLDDESVQACPPSAWYGFRKFARRNRLTFAATALVAACLMIAVVMLAVSNALIRAEQARTGQERSIAVQSQRTAEERAEQLRQGVLDLQASHRLLERGRICLSEQCWDDAHAAFTRSIELRPEYAGPWEARGDLYLRLGLFDLATHDLNRAYGLQESAESSRWMYLAILRLNEGDAEGYRAVSARMREQFGGTTSMLAALDTARIAILLPDSDADPRDSVEVLQSLISQDPNNAFCRFVLGLAYYRAGLFEQAIAEMQQTLTLAPDWNARRIAYPTLAMSWHRLGRDTEARRALSEAALTIDEWTGQICAGNNGNWAVNQGVCHWPIYWWDWMQCCLLYREAKLLIDHFPPPADPRIYVLQARGLAALRRTTMAVVAYDAAVAQLPDDPQIEFESRRARGYLNGYRDWPQAAREFAAARRLMPDQTGIWNFEAVSQLAAGNREAYRQLCSQMLERFAATADPSMAQNVVFACVLESDAVSNPSQLIPLGRVADRLHHGNSRVLGAAYYRAGKYEEAVRQLEASVHLVTPRSWEWCFLAMAHHHLGHTAEANRCLQSAARWIANADRTPPPDVRNGPLEWGGFTERFEFPLLYAEAAALIGSSQSNAAPPITQNQTSDFRFHHRQLTSEN